MEEETIGEVRLWAGLRVPRGWHVCDGSLLNISSNVALYSVLGTTYGGDGAHTFALPKVEGLGGLKYIIAVTGYYPQND